MHGLHSHPSLTSHGSHASQRESHYVSSDGTLAASTSYGRCSPGVETHKRSYSETFTVPVNLAGSRSRSGPGVEDGAGSRLHREGSDSKYSPGKLWSRLDACKLPALLLLLFLLPFLLAMLEAPPSGLGGPAFDIFSRFRVNLHGQRIYRDKYSAARVTGSNRGERVKAAIVVLARNKDIEAVLLSMSRMEASFNSKFNYPYVFLNNDKWEEDFRNRTQDATNARCLYGLIPQEHWSYPKWISPEAAAAARARMVENSVLYGGRESYHHMCRYFSGYIHKHPILKEFDFYWRMEPDVHYYCSLDYDPFLYMQQNSMKYGFVITIQELPKTIPTLWTVTQEFMAKHAKLIPENNLLEFVTSKDGSYNLCHFWSNFEIGDLNFFRSKQYQAYFDFLDKAGGFYLERWGDAPVHSLAVAMFLSVDEVHWFQDIGYRHNSMKHCPAVNRDQCACDAMEAVAFHKPAFGVCHKLWDELYGQIVSVGP